MKQVATMIAVLLTVGLSACVHDPDEAPRDRGRGAAWSRRPRRQRRRNARAPEIYARSDSLIYSTGFGETDHPALPHVPHSG